MRPSGVDRRRRGRGRRRDVGAPPTGPRDHRPAAWLFVDGVRRIDARVWIDRDDGDAVPGVFASYAAGVVRCDGTAELVEAAIGRGLVPTRCTGRRRDPSRALHRGDATKDASPEATNTAANRDMAECEATISERGARGPTTSSSSTVPSAPAGTFPMRSV